jgi:hypothetical protein
LSGTLETRSDGGSGIVYTVIWCDNVVIKIIIIIIIM